jgi:hypothetical protein
MTAKQFIRKMQDPCYKSEINSTLVVWDRETDRSIEIVDIDFDFDLNEILLIRKDAEDDESA